MPRDLTKKMQSAAGDDEDFAVPVDEDMEGPMKVKIRFIEKIFNTRTSVAPNATLFQLGYGKSSAIDINPWCQKFELRHGQS